MILMVLFVGFPGGLWGQIVTLGCNLIALGTLLGHVGSLLGPPVDILGTNLEF